MQHVDVLEPAQPLLPQRGPGPGEEPDRPQRGAAGAFRDDLVDAALRHGEPERPAHDQLEIYRRGVAGEARPACCPAPFDVENNWMHEFPTAYVIPVGAGQRSNPEANRLVDCSSTASRCASSAPTRRSSARTSKRPVRRRHGAGPPGASPRRRSGSASTSPAGSASSTHRPRRGATASSGAQTCCRCRTACPHGEDDAADREANRPRRRCRERRPTTTRSRSTRRPRCGRRTSAVDGRTDREARDGTVHVGRRLGFRARCSSTTPRPG